jgi:uncharacterized protein (TIGR00369 family)
MADRPAQTFGVVPPEVLLSQDGLAFLTAIFEGRLPYPPIMQTLEFWMTVCEPERVVFTSEPSFAHYNPLGVVHGGYAATLLDSAVACAIQTTMRKGEVCTTLELKLNLVRAMTQDTGPVTTEGRVLYRGRSVATAEGYIRDRDGKLYAHATTACIIIPAKD